MKFETPFLGSHIFFGSQKFRFQNLDACFSLFFSHSVEKSAATVENLGGQIFRPCAPKTLRLWLVFVSIIVVSPMIWHILTEPYILISFFSGVQSGCTLPIELVPSGNQTWQWTIHHDDWSLLSFFDSIDDLNGDLARSLRLTSFRNSALRISASSVLEKASAELCPQAQLAETIRFRAPKLHQMGISSNFLSHGPQVTMGWMIILGTNMT